MSWCSDAPEDESISLFAGLLGNPDVRLSRWKHVLWAPVTAGAWRRFLSLSTLSSLSPALSDKGGERQQVGGEDNSGGGGHSDCTGGGCAAQDEEEGDLYAGPDVAKVCVCEERERERERDEKERVNSKP